VLWYLRAAGSAAVGRGNTFVFVGPGRDPIALDGIDTDAMASVLAATAVPIARAALEELCGAPTIDRLVELGVLRAGSEQDLADRAPPRPVKKRCRRLVVAVSGAIRTASFLGTLIELADGFADEIDVIVSHGARKLVRPRLYEYYGMRVWTDAFAPAHGVAVPHKHLAAADLILVAPASASTISRLATGACSDLASLVVAVTEAPVVVAPSMNPRMWVHPPIARNVAQLRADGLWVLEPEVGVPVAARDERGVGGMIDGQALFRALDAVLAHHAR
jgi:3-polyprenyl-4-hydroxybenzoate decarboxylase